MYKEQKELSVMFWVFPIGPQGYDVGPHQVGQGGEPAPHQGQQEHPRVEVGEEGCKHWQYKDVSQELDHPHNKVETWQDLSNFCWKISAA